MNCEEATKLMDGYLDGELDPITSQTIEQYLRDCPNCDQAYKTHGSLIRVIGNTAPYYKAPAELRERIRSSLREEMVARPMRNVGRDVQQLFPTRQPGPRTVLFGASWNWLALAAAILLVSNYQLEFTPSIATTRDRSIIGNAAYRQSCAFADGKPPYRCCFLRPTHSQTLAGYQARFRASGGRSCQRRISFNRRSS